MSRQKKLMIMPKLHDYDGDVSKQWFVFYSYRNPASGKMHRFRLYEGFTGLQTAQQKTLHGEQLIEKLRLKLQNGWSPFDDDQKVVYHDSLQYQETAKKYGRKRLANKRFHYYTNLWLSEMMSIRPATYTSYKSKLRYFNFFLEEKGINDNDITEFNRDNATDFNLWLKRKRKLKNKTINEYNVLMKSFFTWLVDKNLLSKNPFSHLKKLKVETIKPRIFSEELMQKISQHAEQTDPQLLLSIRIIYNCFIRPGELRQLKMDEFDFKRGIITVPAAVAKDKQERKVDIPVYLLDIMISEGLDKYPMNYFIISEKDKPGLRKVGRNHLYRKWVALKERLDLPQYYNLYAFKHTGMVMLKLSGADWIDIKQQAGHESLDQTIEYTTALMAEGSHHIRTKSPRF